MSRLGEHVGEEVTTCGLVVEQRTHHQITGEPMKFLTLADWTGLVETELFAQTYRSYGLATVRYPVYLVHWPIIIVCMSALLHFNSQINRHQMVFLLPLICLPVVLLVAQCLHRFVEKPLMKFGRS